MISTVIESRLKARKGHFFKTQMLVTQFETLQEPGADERDVLVVDIDQPAGRRRGEHH